MQSDKNTIAKIAAILGLFVTITVIALNLLNIIKIGKRPQEPVITIENNLALPVVVNVNNGSYVQQIKANATKTITLLSESEFPVSVKWEVIRNKNAQREPLGEALHAEFKKVDKGKVLEITNQIGINSYFYPKIINNTDQKCVVVLNDGLTIETYIGATSPHTQTNITGYYKYATNSNITVICPDQTYWRGIRNGQPGPALHMEADSGIIVFPVP
ncbi:MAG: hypothetical protein ACOYYJ_15065 [Chloroflexota bacterium]